MCCLFFLFYISLQCKNRIKKSTFESMDDISAWNCSFSRRHQQDGAKSTKALAPRFLQSWWECLTRTTAAETNCSEQAPQLTLSYQDKVRYVKFPATAGQRCEDSKLENWWKQIRRDTRIYPDIPRYTQIYRFGGGISTVYLGISWYIWKPGCPDIPTYTQIYRWYTTPKTVYLGIPGYIWVYLGISWYLLPCHCSNLLMSHLRPAFAGCCCSCYAGMLLVFFVCAVQFRV